MLSSAAIRRANKATAAELAVCVQATRAVCEKNLSFTLKAASDICDDEGAQIWRMFEKSMHELYQSSSLGWDPRQKKREMFHRLSRFVIVRDTSHATDDLASLTNIIAYSIFRFEKEDHQDVVYCYELQVSEESRRFGLGRLLTQILSDIGAQWGMSKIMLTVFKANYTAMLFYQSIGFSMDESSPDFSKGGTEDECDYAILSRRITA